jgi:hypothetical protein
MQASAASIVPSKIAVELPSPRVRRCLRLAQYVTAPAIIVFTQKVLRVFEARLAAPVAREAAASTSTKAGAALDAVPAASAVGCSRRPAIRASLPRSRGGCVMIWHAVHSTLPSALPIGAVGSAARAANAACLTSYGPIAAARGEHTPLRNHADGTAAMDLFVVPTISFRLL